MLASIPLLPNLENLECTYCQLVVDIPCFPHLMNFICVGCPLLAVIPPFPILMNLLCDWCTSIAVIPPLPNLQCLMCNNCPSITIIPYLPNLSRLYCGGCPSLTTIPFLYNLIYLECYDCRLILNINLPNVKGINCSGCLWLDYENKYYKKNISSLIVLQKYIKRLVRYRRFTRFIKSREFNEWFYAPDGIGGRTHKIQIEHWFTKNIL